MNSKIIMVILIIFSIMMLAVLANFMPSAIVLIPLGLILLSLVLFSRGILIFLTALCLSFAQSPSLGMIASAAMRLRWIFFALFTFHVFDFTSLLGAP